jgi:hypothetical protein
MMSGPGNSPPKNNDVTHVPTSGIDSATEYTMRSPVPESWSSSSEYPNSPFSRARISRVQPMIQLSSRGRRKAPVKNTRARCTEIDARNNSAAQWWICRITSPARTSKLSSSADR